MLRPIDSISISRDQLSVLRAKSASSAVVKRQSDKLGQDEVDLHDVQMESLVLKEELYLIKVADSCNSSKRTSHRGLTQERTKELKNCLEQLYRPKLEKAKIVATTLNNASQDILWPPRVLEPQILICGKAGNPQKTI